MAGAGVAENEASLSWRGELWRKAIHLTSLAIPAGYFIFDARQVLLILIGLLISCAFFDLMRFFGNDSVKKFMGLNFGFMLRPREKKSFSGATTILLAGLLVFLFYDKRIAAAAMVIVVIGDVAAALIGRTIGRFRIYYKTLEGTLAFIAFTAVAIRIVPGLSWKIVIVGVIAGAITELLPLPIDDNISVPLVAGGFMQLLFNQQLMYR